MYITIEHTESFEINLVCAERTDNPFSFEILPRDGVRNHLRLRFYKDMIAYEGRNFLFKKLSSQIKQLPTIDDTNLVLKNDKEGLTWCDEGFKSECFESGAELHHAYIHFFESLTEDIKAEISEIAKNIEWLQDVSQDLAKKS